MPCLALFPGVKFIFNVGHGQLRISLWYGLRKVLAFVGLVIHFPGNLYSMVQVLKINCNVNSLIDS